MFKYALEAISSTQLIELKSEPISVAFQNDQLVLWAFHVDETLARKFRVRCVMTGEDVDVEIGLRWHHLGTVTSRGGFVVHVFWDYPT